MAIAASPNSKANIPAPRANKKKKIRSSSEEQKEIKSETKSDNPISQSQKRNSNPGVRVIGGRIYDSQNGTTCHQCRQKTYAVYVNCKNKAKTKPCNIKYCRTCLLNRYGEKVEDVELLDQWDCPKCKGVCNCSICMKRRGHQPTGQVVQMAKASGFTSVSDMIDVKGVQNVSNYKRVKETTASPRKPDAPKEGNVIKSPKNSGKENLFDGKTDSNANPVEKKPKKGKRKGFEGKIDGNGVNDVSEIETNNQKKSKSKGSKSDVENVIENKPKEIKSDGNVFIDGSIADINHALLELKQKKVKSKESKETFEGINIIHDQYASQPLEDNKFFKLKGSTSNLVQAVVTLPAGTELVNVAGVDLPKEDAGNALQLLEFCYTFGKILDVKKGQAEAVLRDLIKGRSTRRGKFTSVTQFHIQLLSVIQAEDEEESESESESPTSDLTHGNDSWLKALKSCISKSKVKQMDTIDLTAGGYDNLESSMKLKLLVFLCDEILETDKIRNWIDEQNVEFAEKKKEAKEKLSVAKDKEKSLRQKMQDNIAKAVIAKKGVPLTMQEHHAIVSKIKNKTAEAHAEMLACKEMVPEDIARPDAVRTEAIFKDNGHMYWRLKGSSEKPGILLQDIGTGDHTVELVDKWFEFDEEQMNVIEKHIKVLRSRFGKHYKN